MEDSLLEILLKTSDDVALRMLVATHALDESTIQWLKNDSARFYYDRPEEAVRRAGLAYRLGQILPDSAAALGSWAFANALLFADRYHEAIDLFEQARTVYLAVGAELSAARLSVGYVWALAYIGAFDRALELAATIEPVLTVAAESDVADRRRLGGLFNNIGILYDILGRYEESLAAYDRKLALASALNNELDVARTQHNRACVLIYLNAFDEALVAFDQAESTLKTQAAIADLARLAFSRGTLYARWRRYVQAESAFSEAEQSLANLEHVEQFRAVVKLYQALARLSDATWPLDVVLADLISAQSALAINGPLFEEGLAWLGLGQCHLRLGQFDEAQAACREAVRLAENGAGQPLAYAALHQLGKWAEASKNVADAIDFYAQALDQIETGRHTIQVAALRASFLIDKLVVYEDLVALYISGNQLEQAFATVERAKSRLLVEQLTTRLGAEVNKFDSTANETSLELVHRLQQVLANLERLYQRSETEDLAQRGEAILPTTDPAIALEITRLERSAVSLGRQIEQQLPRLICTPVDYTATLVDLCANLPDAQLLYYHIMHGRTWVFAINRSGIQVHCNLADEHQVELVRKRFSVAVERVLGLTARYGVETANRYLPTLLADANTHLADLYDLLLRPIENLLRLPSTLVISPDGILHTIPFHALFDGQNYLLERHAVSYIPNSSVLKLCSRQEASGQGMLLAGYGGHHLPHITAEIESLQRLFSEATCLSGIFASTESVLANMPHYRIVHLAAHANFRSDHAELSSLTFADRRLTLAEISQLSLSAELVTLSGCETGRGQLHGTDLISLANSFVGAGAKALLVSLWRVDDAATAHLMGEVYHAIKQGHNKALALQHAQRRLLELGRISPTPSVYLHPAFWAPFILIGDQRPIA